MIILRASRTCPFFLFMLIGVLIAANPLCASAHDARDDSLAISRASIRNSLLYGLHQLESEKGSRVASSLLHESAGPGLRSLPLAFGLSALIPGAGQAYNRQWVKAAVAVSVDVVFLATYLSRQNDGQLTQDAFQAFAKADWDPVQYGDWLNNYTVFLNAEFGSGIDVPEINTNIGVDFHNPDSWSSADWTAVHSMFAQINTTERSVFHPETGASFSHQLPRFGDQQYYELIGKYFQFAPGWSDYPRILDGEGDFTVAIDPEKTGKDGSKPNVSDKFFSYAKDHAESQDLFRNASKFGLLIALNHIVAAVDAVITAKTHNDRLTTRLEMTMSRAGTAAPVVGVGFRL